jgi:hypothetical protein
MRSRETAFREIALRLHGINGGYADAQSRIDIQFVRVATPTRVVVELSHLGKYRHQYIGDPSYPCMVERTEFAVELHTFDGRWFVAEVLAIRQGDPLTLPTLTLPTDSYVSMSQRAQAQAYSRGAAIGDEAPTAEPLPDIPGPSSEERYGGEEKNLSDTGPGTRDVQILASGYNYAAMANYAVKWANDFNGAYPRWNNDCTNFVSQCMLAGGWSQITAGYFSRSDYKYWWVDGGSTSSYSWSGAQHWRNFAWYRGRYTALSSIWNLSVGDVLGWDWIPSDGSLDHLQICQSNNYGDPLMAQHSGPYHSKRLSTIVNASTGNQQAKKYAHRT